VAGVPGSISTFQTEVSVAPRDGVAVLEHNAAGFVYPARTTPPADVALAHWATEIVPAVREAITR
jgi:hypothetical protein